MLKDINIKRKKVQVLEVDMKYLQPYECYHNEQTYLVKLKTQGTKCDSIFVITSNEAEKTIYSRDSYGESRLGGGVETDIVLSLGFCHTPPKPQSMLQILVNFLRSKF